MENWRQAPPERRTALDRWLYALCVVIIWLIAALDLAAGEAGEPGTSPPEPGCRADRISQGEPT